MALPTAATMAGQIVTALGLPTGGHSTATSDWTSICQVFLNAIAAGVVTVNLADGTGVAHNAQAGSSDVGLTGSVTGTIA